MPLNAKPHALLIKFPGTNCDAETARALQLTGFDATIQPISVVDGKTLGNYQLMVFCGGFSYGDYVMSGRFAQLEIEKRLGTAVQDYYGRGGHVLGICNGFQILTRIGILPEGSLIDNASGRFVCRWTGLKLKTNRNAFLQDLPEQFELPVAHAEGRLVTADPETAQRHLARGIAALTYTDNFNGSTCSIAGMQDPDGRALGLMPHPERFIYRRHHYNPDWEEREWGWGYYIFKSIHNRLAAAA